MKSKVTHVNQHVSPCVLHVRVVSGHGGGPDKTILSSPRYVDKSRYQMEAVYLHNAHDPGILPLIHKAITCQCPFHAISEKHCIDRQSYRELEKLVRESNVKIWHGHDYKSNLLGLLIRRHWPMKLITTAHGWTDETWRMRLYHRIDKWVLKKYDHVIAVSSDQYQTCVNLGINKHKLTLIHNAIEPKDYQRQHSVEQAKFNIGLDQSDQVLGIVGRLSIEKGVDRALPVIKQLTKQIHNLKVVIIGDGAEREKLKHLSHQMSLDNTIMFKGWQNPLQPWYEAMDLLLLPSHTEGLPNVLLEAMAMDVPVAATDVGGVRELLDDGQCGTVLPNSPRQWIDPLAMLLNDHAYANQVAKHAKIRVTEKYNFNHRMIRIVSLYDHLMDNTQDSTQKNTPRNSPDNHALYKHDPPKRTAA